MISFLGKEELVYNMKQLNRKTAQLPANKPLKVLQFGGGNFLRAFVDWMIDELNQQAGFNGGVVVIKPTEKGDYTTLRTQDGLFHVITKGIQAGNLVSETQLIECVQTIIHPYNQWSAFLNTAQSPSLRFIVSNTTEAGIQFNSTDTFDDAAPKEFPAKLTRWLYARWQHFKGSPESGCIHLPCELIAENGQQLKKCLLQYADLWELEAGFKDWINQHHHFCNTLVDRIVPGFPKENIEATFQTLGYEDQLVAEAEPYHIWVIEGDETIQKELPFSQTNLNVVFTDDLSPYRQLKVRMLNGAHTTMVPIGYLANIETVRAAVEDEVVGRIIKTALFEEISTTLDFPEAQKKKYANDVLDRFKNPFIHHQLISISLNSTSKYKTRVLPSLLAYHQKYNKLPDNLTTALAALIAFYRGKRGEEDIPLRDSDFALSFFKNGWQQWEKKTITTTQLVETVLQETTFWEQDLSKIEGLVPLITEKLTAFVE